MMRIIVLALSIVCGLLVTQPSFAHAFDVLGPSAQCSPTSDTSSSAICTDNKTENGQKPNDDPIADRLRSIANIIAIVAGAAAILLILVAGIEYATSDGDTNKINSAKTTIIYALIGVIVVSLAAAIIEFMVSRL